MHSLSSQPFTQVQIRFFVTVLQLMARADEKTALLSPAIGSSMESRMEGKLASMNLKSPGLESNNHSSPSARISIPALRTASRQPSTHPPPSSYLPILPIPSTTQAKPRRPSLNSAPNSKLPATPSIAYMYRLTPRGHQSAIHGPASVHSARSRSAILPHAIYFLRT